MFAQSSTIKVALGVALVRVFLQHDLMAEAFETLNSPALLRTSQLARLSSGPSPLSAIEFRGPIWTGRFGKGAFRSSATVGLRATTTETDRTVKETTTYDANLFGAPLEAQASKGTGVNTEKETDSLGKLLTTASNLAIDSVSEIAQNTVGLVKGSEPVKGRRSTVPLDSIVANKAQLTVTEFLFLVSSVIVAAIAPFLLPFEPVKVLVPTLAATSAAIGVSAEYTGKTAVANGKEIAATTLQAAAEAEAVLAGAERVKAVIPLTVGIATSAATFALLVPVFLEELATRGLKGLGNGVVLFPIISVLSASMAGIAVQECRSLCRRAIGIGNRRFASSSSVGRDWLSDTERIGAKSLGIRKKWKNFAVALVPAPLFAMFFPGSLASKCIIAAAIGVGQTAWYIAVAEYEIARAMDAVAFKLRSAAVAETYANEGMRAGSILPFTSALSALCAASTAAAVELLPMISAVEIQVLAASFFPAGAALFAAAASVSKRRCENDAAMASSAAEKIAVPPKGILQNQDSLLPVKGIIELTCRKITSV